MFKLRLLALTLSLLGAAAPAFAHAFLRASEPANETALKTAPKEVVITFTEEIAPRFSGITVTDAAGARVDTGPLIAKNQEGTHFGIALKPLAPGVYSVQWHAVSADDGHKTAGSFRFTVLAP
jgi:methionine-rich copper-binding protein CopC